MRLPWLNHYNHFIIHSIYLVSNLRRLYRSRILNCSHKLLRPCILHVRCVRLINLIVFHCAPDSQPQNQNWTQRFCYLAALNWLSWKCVDSKIYLIYFHFRLFGFWVSRHHSSFRWTSLIALGRPKLWDKELLWTSGHHCPF
jgi:hypothetical protein